MRSIQHRSNDPDALPFLAQLEQVRFASHQIGFQIRIFRAVDLQRRAIEVDLRFLGED